MRARLTSPILLAFLLFLEAGCGGESADPAPPRAIVFVSIDTLRADHLGLYGHHRFTSPVLDAFGAGGAVFEDASATTAWTLPSHASMLTGLYPGSHGVVDARTALADEVDTLADFFAAEGWDTAAVINVMWLKREHYGLTRGFEKYLSIEDSDYGRRAPSSWTTDQAMQWLGEQGERPLFLFVHYYDVHADYASLPEYERLFVSPYEGQADGSAWQIERANFAEAHIAYCLEEFDPGQCQFGSPEKPRRIDETMERIEFEGDDVKHLEELYDAGIRQLDTELGRLFSFIEASGRAEDTLVVITSDHGEEFMEHGRLGHFLHAYQQSLRVPLIMRGPGIPPGLRIDVPVSSVDLAPSLLALAGLEALPDFEGLDLSELLKGEAPGEFATRALYGEANGGVQQASGLPGVYPIFRSVRRGSMKLIERRLAGVSEYSLFDLAEDPGEQQDLASAHPQLVSELREILAARAVGGAGRRGAEVELDESEIEKLRALGYVP
ncbi:MAG: sulfatase [Myxococcota bacterium]|nr:sulfatase [Myxococcota bacterium]